MRPDFRAIAAVLSLTLVASVEAQNKKNDPSQIGNRDVGKGVNFYSLEKEIALGKQLAEEVARQAKIVDDPLISEYVNRLGQNLVRNSDAKVPFTFQVIDAEVPNAFALPGGFVFVNTGLIEIAEEEVDAGLHEPADAVTGEEFDDRFGMRREIAEVFVKHENEVDSMLCVKAENAIERIEGNGFGMGGKGGGLTEGAPEAATARGKQHADWNGPAAGETKLGDERRMLDFVE